MSIPAEREQTRLEIERVIRRFEPRLKNVVVTLQANVDTVRSHVAASASPVSCEPSRCRSAWCSIRELEPSTAAIEIKAVP